MLEIGNLNFLFAKRRSIVDGLYRSRSSWFCNMLLNKTISDSIYESSFLIFFQISTFWAFLVLLGYRCIRFYVFLDNVFLSAYSPYGLH